MTEHRLHSRLLGQHLHVVGKVVFFLYVCLKAVWHFVKVVLPNATDEAGRLGRKKVCTGKCNVNTLGCILSLKTETWWQHIFNALRENITNSYFNVFNTLREFNTNSYLDTLNFTLPNPLCIHVTHIYRIFLFFIKSDIYLIKNLVTVIAPPVD